MATGSAEWKKVIDEAVNDFVENGFDDPERLARWEKRIAEAAGEAIGSASAMDEMLREILRATYEKMVAKGGIAKHHPGLSRWTYERLRPEFRAELDKRIMASANLIRLNKTKMVQQTLSRFGGWATSIPAGGSENVDKREEKDRIKKPLASLPFETRRVLTDQGHKLISSLNEVVAVGGDAIAAVWHSRWRQPNYDYREDHKERDLKVYGIDDSWAVKAGLVKKPPEGWTRDITKPAEEPFCRCSYVYVYTLRELSRLCPEMITEKGWKWLEDAAAKLKAARA